MAEGDDNFAVLLDVDGTLVDSNDAHARAWVEALAEFGHQVPFEKIRRTIGKGADKLLPETIGVNKDSSEGKRISERRAKIFMTRYLPNIRPFPDVRALLERMRSDGLRLVVATSAQDEEMDALLEVAGVADLLKRKTSASDAEHSKPDSDIVKAALQRAECTPERAIFLGDTPYDVAAAERAGVQSIALRSGGWSTEDLAGAAAVFDDARHLLASYDSSPLATLSRYARAKTEPYGV
jgi:HAD superfamily hydrolase (TIGR01509 family)